MRKSLTNFTDGIVYFVSRHSSKIRYTILTLIIFLGLLLRANELAQGNFSSYDTNRDYLVASHMVKYGEISLVGPGSMLGKGTNSPVYYYFIAALLKIKDSVVFLEYFNLFLQVLTIPLIYFLASLLFSKTTGLVAALLWSLSNRVVFQSGFLWQPHIMEPFAILSYLLLALGYYKNKASFIFMAIPVFIFAMVMHNSVLIMLPIFLSAVIGLLWSMRRSLAVCSYAGATFALSLLAAYSPLIIYYLHNPFVSDGKSFVFAATSIPIEMLKRVSDFTESFFQNNNSVDSLILAISLGLASSIYFKKISKGSQQKTSYIIIAAITFFIAATALATTSTTPFPNRYFTPINGLFIIMLSAILTAKKPSTPIEGLLRFATFILVTISTTTNLSATAHNIKSRIPSSNPIEIVKALFYDPPIEREAISVIKNTLTRIQETEQRKNFGFFQIREYYDSETPANSIEPLLVALENALKEKLATVDNNAIRGYRMTGTDDYILLRCRYHFVNNTSECLKNFLASDGNYNLLGHIASESDKRFDRYDVYLLSKNL